MCCIAIALGAAFAYEGYRALVFWSRIFKSKDQP